MKRGISFALPMAGLLLACHSTSLSRYGAAQDPPGQGHDTVYYYSEKGSMIFCDTTALSPGNYVIRTCKTKEEIFPEWYDENKDTTLPPGDYRPADVNPITAEEARLVFALIRRGSVYNPMVIRNVIPILDKKTIRKMMDAIKDSHGNANDKTDFFEFGGIVKRDSSITCHMSIRYSPCSSSHPELKIEPGGISDYHSHPSGEKDSVINAKKTITCSFAQGPSNTDQCAKRKGSGYVFGMNQKHHRIYIYDSTGVLATLPFSYLDR